ncbi:MAG: low molecular weight protein-tyrosine-phosphatase [Pseudomonadota bacterium]
MRILCVCLGNICRSPMAEGAIRKMGDAAGLALQVDSAGTGAYHIGNPPDPRGLAAASARGYDNTGQRARQVQIGDFERFDLIVAMDRTNLANLQSMAPPGSPAEIRLFHPEGAEIPDPYYGGPADYDHALDLVELSARALIESLVERAG